jgi:hypothetical protein
VYYGAVFEAKKEILAYTLPVTSRFLITTLTALWICCPPPLAGQEVPIRIEINSSWRGLGKPTGATFVISGVHGNYAADDRKIDRKLVDSLLSALREPVVPKPFAVSCGITEQWLSANYEEALHAYTNENINDWPHGQVELFRSHFTDIVAAQATFERLFAGQRFDDYPKISVTVNLGDEQFGVLSDSWRPFMLPWSGTSPAGGGYNCKISQAIAALLPEDFPNRKRLLPDRGFRREFTSRTIDALEPQWNLLNTKRKIGPALDPIFARYTPLKSNISYLSSTGLSGQSWNAELQSQQLPGNLVLEVSLRYENNNLIGVDTLLTELPKYTTLVISVPWLSTYLVQNPKVIAKLRYVDGRSLSLKEQAGLIDDLKEHATPELANSVSQNGSGAAVLDINEGSGCWTMALVFPNKDVLPWHFKCDSVLGFPAKDFATWDRFGWRSTGTIIKPDYTLRAR